MNPDKPGGRQLCVRNGCDDGSNHNQFSCCGLRKCNIFCCNCDKTGDGKSMSFLSFSNSKFILKEKRGRGCGMEDADEKVVCRVSKDRSLEGGDEEESEPEELRKSDEEMFRIANEDESGKMTLEQFWKYMGAEDGDHYLAVKFAE